MCLSNNRAGSKLARRPIEERGLVWFYVKDNGPGIPASVLPNIFHPFYTTKGVGVGTGLGLYISYEIVKKHGGEIIVDTALGQGTQFRWSALHLPRRAKPISLCEGG